MQSVEFLQLALDDSAFLIIVSIVLMLCLYWMTFRVAGGLSDPFHFFYAFTFGTSYAVVALLAITGNIDLPQIAMIAGFGLVFLIGYRIFSRVSIQSLHRAVSLCGGGRTFFQLAVVVYFSAALIYVIYAGVPFLSASRFETNSGFGLAVRIMDPLRLFILAYLALEILKLKHRTKLLYGCAAICFAAVSSLLNGSKFALLECAYVAAVSVAIGTGRKALPFKKILWPASLVLLLATGYALTQLFFNLKAAKSQGIGNLDSVALGPLVFDTFAARLVGNGDMYFLGLPPQVLHAIHVDHPLAQLLGPMLGYRAVSTLFGYDMTNTDVGRQIMLYWNPGYPPGAGGPTNHFDMTAYAYFGPIGGIPFVMCLAFILAQVNRLKQHKYGGVGCAAVATFYCRSLAILLNPAIGLSLLSDVIIIFLLISILAKVINAAAITQASRLPVPTGGLE